MDIRDSLLPKQIELGGYYKHKLDGADFTEPNYPMWNIQKAILDWNLVRGNVVYDALAELDMYEKEAQEAEEPYDYLRNLEGLTEEQILDFKCEIVDSICDRYVVMTGTLAKSGYDEAPLSGENLTNYLDEFVLPKALMEDYGIEFDFKMAMEETIKEISARVQDPIQKSEWELNGSNGQKWEKWKDQPEETLYKADYVKCLL